MLAAFAVPIECHFASPTTSIVDLVSASVAEQKMVRLTTLPTLIAMVGFDGPCETP